MVWKFNPAEFSHAISIIAVVSSKNKRAQNVKLVSIRRIRIVKEMSGVSLKWPQDGSGGMTEWHHALRWHRLLFD